MGTAAISCRRPPGTGQAPGPGPAPGTEARPTARDAHVLPPRGGPRAPGPASYCCPAALRCTACPASCCCPAALRCTARPASTEGASAGPDVQQKASGSGMARTVLTLCLLLAAVLWGGLTQALGPMARPGPLLLRLQRLEKQFLRLQEVTLSHLQSIAENYNISYNIDGRFWVLMEQVEAAAADRAALGTELARLDTASRQLHRRLKRLEGTVGALNPAYLPLTHPRRALAEAGTKLHSLTDAAQSWGSQLEQELQGQVAPSILSHQPLKAKQREPHRQEEGHQLPADAKPDGVPGEDAEFPHDAVPGPQAVTLMVQTVTVVPQVQPLASQQSGEDRYRTPTLVPSSPACHTGAVLLFPNTSAKHMAILELEPHQELQALSLCAWLATSAPSLGALISYITQDGGSKLAVRGHDGDLSGSAQFVIGEGQFRQLPVMPLLDGKWHHLCLTWSSSQGQYRFYVDRRLLAAGSGFQQGYEIPAGGSWVLGWEQDHPGRVFGTTAFVGHLAGFGLWSRALLPGEVASMATGQGLSHGPLLMLDNASLQGEVQKVVCSCPQHCL
ncbi:pentraxin-4 [Indicator indicator]|uniref:pentraxin-4 n=1 Tax=Indicator indicator TaxID=1002788 RepID=UPI0023DE7A4F|nr:pentraxin-4 [Indicator indicator]